MTRDKVSRPAATIDVAAAIRLGYSVRSGDELTLVVVLVLAAVVPVVVDELVTLPVPPTMVGRGSGIV
jgi:hypothetical protein